VLLQCRSNAIGDLPARGSRSVAERNEWQLEDRSWLESLQRLATHIVRNQQLGFATNFVLHDGGHRAPSVSAAAQLIRRYRYSRRFVTLDDWQ
jgi:hypothetical protein